MMQASRSYQNSVEAINTAKQLALRTLTLGEITTMINNTPSDIFTGLNPNNAVEASRSRNVSDMGSDDFFGAHDCRR